jgi:hypothetical protein
MTEDCRLVTLAQLVELRPFLTERWVRSMVASGRGRSEEDRLPHYRVGGKLVFDLDEFDAFVRRGRRGKSVGTVSSAENSVVTSPAPPLERDKGPPAATRGPSMR